VRALCSCGRAEVELGMDLCALCRRDFEARQQEEQAEEDSFLDRMERDLSTDDI
jgi:hypothetical protein